MKCEVTGPDAEGNWAICEEGGGDAIGDPMTVEELFTTLLLYEAIGLEIFANGAPFRPSDLCNGEK